MEERINSNELKAQLARNEMTQRDLADMIGISITGLWKKMTGKNSFTLEEVRKIRDVLKLDDCSLRDIFLI